MPPNFTGIWKLIPTESDFSFLSPPQLRVDTIAHEDPRLQIRTRQKDTNGDITLDRDVIIGGETATIFVRGRARLIRAFWEDAVLVIETISEVSGKARRIEDRWSLDADSGGAAEWLTIERRFEQSGGAVRQRLRLQRD